MSCHTEQWTGEDIGGGRGALFRAQSRYFCGENRWKAQTGNIPIQVTSVIA
jgi:hypothetical protein